MTRALYTAATGLAAQQFNTDVISNNLANVNTVGFKKVRADFQDLLYQTLQLAGTPSSVGTQVPVGIQVGHGATVAATSRMFTQGSFRQTENQLDMVIEGDGFFQILMPDGSIAYTRDGAFKLDGDGNLVTNDGNFLEPQITVSADAINIEINPEGVVTEELPGGVRNQIGQIELAKFLNPAGLQAQGSNLFQETPASGPPNVSIPGQDGAGNIRQGFLEISNVNVAEELVNLIVAQRAYEVNSRSIQTQDSMLQTAASLKR